MMGFDLSSDPEPPVDSLIEFAKSAREDLVQTRLAADPLCCLATDDEGRTALHWAVEFGYSRLARLLLDAASPTSLGDVRDRLLNCADKRGQTALHVACNARQPDIATFLVTAKTNLSLPDLSGNTALHRAVRNNVDAAARLMCEAGADVNARNDVAWTPLHEATRTGNLDLLHVLIQHGADTDAVTSNRMSPFLTAFFYYKIASRGSSYPNLEAIWTRLIAAGCQLSLSDGHWSPLTAAMASDNTLVAALLLYHGCRLGDRRTRGGRGLLQETFCCGEPMLVKLLVLLGYQPAPDEVAYCVKQIPMYSKVFTRLAGLASGIHRDRQTVVTWLKQRGLEPPSLAEWCRVSIRAAMNEATDDRSIVKNIRLLPLPTRLKDFVAMSDFTHYICD